MVGNLFDMIGSLRGRRKLIRLSQYYSIGSNFCSSPMYGNRFKHILHSVHFKGGIEKIFIGNFCNLSLSIKIFNNGEVFIGDYVYMNSGCRFYIANTLRIGSNCLLGPEVIIWDTDNHSLDVSERHEQTIQIPYNTLNSFVGGGNVRIGDDVWIGLGTLILGGVTIGNGSVVAARSVVTHDIPPMSLAAGVPAKVIKSII